MYTFGYLGPVATGTAFTTFSLIRCEVTVFEPAASFAVASRSVEPKVFGDTVTVEPARSAVATAGFEEETE